MQTSGTQALKKQLAKRVANYKDQLEGRGPSPTVAARKPSALNASARSSLDEEELRAKKLRDLKDLMRNEQLAALASPRSNSKEKFDRESSRDSKPVQTTSQFPFDRINGETSPRNTAVDGYASARSQEGPLSASSPGKLYPLETHDGEKNETPVENYHGIAGPGGKVYNPADFHVRKSKEIRRLQYASNIGKKPEGFPLWVRMEGRDHRAILNNLTGFKYDSTGQSLEVRENDQVSLTSGNDRPFSSTNKNSTVVTGSVVRPTGKDPHCSFVVQTPEGERFPVVISSNCVAYDEDGNEVGRGRVGISGQKYKGIFYSDLDAEPQVVLVGRKEQPISYWPKDQQGSEVITISGMDDSRPLQFTVTQEEEVQLPSGATTPSLIVLSLSEGVRSNKTPLVFIVDSFIPVSNDPKLNSNEASFFNEDGTEDFGRLEVDDSLWLIVEKEKERIRLRLDVSPEEGDIRDVEHWLKKIKEIVDKRKPKVKDQGSQTDFPLAPGVFTEFDLLCPNGDRLRIYIRPDSGQVGLLGARAVDEEITKTFVAAPPSKDYTHPFVLLGAGTPVNSTPVLTSRSGVFPPSIKPSQNVVRVVHYRPNDQERERLEKQETQRLGAKRQAEEERLEKLKQEAENEERRLRDSERRQNQELTELNQKLIRLRETIRNEERMWDNKLSRLEEIEVALT